jgi:hypothetical protein
MNVRRRIFVVLISGEFRTMDNMAAFGKSVNLVLNPENIGDAGAIIKHAIMDNESFYQVFRESSIKAGRL